MDKKALLIGVIIGALIMHYRMKGGY